MSDAFSEVVGQPAAISMLRAAVANPLPAYLLVGSAGCGARAIAISFAAELLAHERDDSQRHRRLAISEEHPDLIVFERTGPSLTVEQAREIVRAATTSPFEGNRKIILVEKQILADQKKLVGQNLFFRLNLCFDQNIIFIRSNFSDDKKFRQKIFPPKLCLIIRRAP